MGREGSWRRLVVSIVCACACGLAFTSGSAAATDFTWSGAAQSGPGSTDATNWSNGLNWTGGVAPSGKVGTLTFPKLTNPACIAYPGTVTSCYSTTNDVSGLNVGAISIDDSAPYSTDYGSFTLGAGGITANPSGPVPPNLAPSFFLSYITLGAPQTWSLDGGGSGDFGGLIFLGGGVFGDYPLTIALSNRGELSLGDVPVHGVYVPGKADVGAVTITGANPSDSGLRASSNGRVSLDSANLNGSDLNADGNPVRLRNAEIESNSGQLGPLTSSGGLVQVGAGFPGTLAVNGAVTLDPASDVDLFINGPGPGPGSVFSSQLSATGAINLADASLRLLPALPLSFPGIPGMGCPSLTTGSVATLVTTTGPLLGKFGGVPDGAIVALQGCAVRFRINYSAHSVTATVLPAAPTNVSPPAISGTPVQGQALTEVHGSWTSNPTRYYYRWEDCGRSGASCSFIAGATTQSYVLSGADVGHTVRVLEAAANDGGIGGPALSAPTAAVQGSPHPVLSELRISPSVFAPARRGPAIARLSTGARISYSDSQAGTTTFTVRRGTPAVLRAGECVKAPTHPHPRGAGRCTRFVHVVGSFTHADAKGQNHFRFTGRLHGRALTPGSYKLTAVPNGPPAVVGVNVSRRFRIRAR